MMYSNLQHMYQAWIQGNEDYARDWYRFVEWAAIINNATTDNILEELKNYSWFKKLQE